MAQFGYPGDRRTEYVDEDDAELALLFLLDGKSMMEIVQLFRDDGHAIFYGCNVYHAAVYLRDHASGF